MSQEGSKYAIKAMIEEVTNYENTVNAFESPN